MLGIMKTTKQPLPRNRAEVVADMNDVSRAVAGKITEKRRTLKNGKPVVYHQLQQWVDGKNVTTHIPKGGLTAFTEAVDGHEKLRSLISELSSVDTKAITEDPAVKKNL
jgi:hypothetical protein